MCVSSLIMSHCLQSIGLLPLAHYLHIFLNLRISEYSTSQKGEWKTRGEGVLMQILLPPSNFCSPFGVFLGSMYRRADQLWWRHIRAHFPHFTIVWSNTLPLLCSNCLFGTGQRWIMASVSLWRKHQTKADVWGTKTKSCVTVSANTTRCGGLEYKDKYRIVFVDFAQNMSVTVW